MDALKHLTEWEPRENFICFSHKESPGKATWPRDWLRWCSRIPSSRQHCKECFTKSDWICSRSKPNATVKFNSHQLKFWQKRFESWEWLASPRCQETINKPAPCQQLCWNTAPGCSQLSTPLHELQQGQEVWMLTCIAPLPRKPKVLARESSQAT